MAEKLKIRMPKAMTIIKYLKMQENTEYFKEFNIGKSKFKRYSPKALDKLKKDLPNLNVEKIWETHKYATAKRR